MSTIGFRIFSLLSTNLKCERSIPLYLKNTQLNFSLYSRAAFFQTLQKIKFTACIKLNTILSQRYCSSNPDQNDKKNKSTPLMKFNPVLKPEIMLTIKNWILTKIIIQPYLDSHFTMKDFTLGAKQALGVVSSFLSQGDFQSLKGLVTDELTSNKISGSVQISITLPVQDSNVDDNTVLPQRYKAKKQTLEAIQEIKGNFASLNVKERQDILIKVADILFAFPYQIGIFFDDANQRRFAEITVVYHCVNDFEEKGGQGKFLDMQNAREDLKICNYRFIREYTKGVQSDWTINRLAHFKLRDFEN